MLPLPLLQIQMRDLPGFLETRQTLLELKSNNKHNWISFALAHHLNGHHEVAAKVLESYAGAGGGCFEWRTDGLYRLSELAQLLWWCSIPGFIRSL